MPPVGGLSMIQVGLAWVGELAHGLGLVLGGGGCPRPWEKQG